MPSLYTLTTEMQEFIEMVDNGEIPEEAIADTLEALEGELEQKIENIALAIKNVRALCSDIKAEEDKLTERRRRKEREAQRLSDYLSEAMKRVGMKRYESARNNITFRTSYGTRITDEEAYIKWARENAPGTIKVTASVKPVLSEVKALTETVNVPFVVIEERKNIQIQ